MKPQQLYKGAQVRFNDNKVLWFKNNLNGIFGFFTGDQGIGTFKRKYSNIESIDGRRLNEIKINKPPKIWDFTKYIPNFNYKDIKINDIIKTTKIEAPVSDIDKEEIPGFELEWWFYLKNKTKKLAYSSPNLEKINNKNNINEINRLQELAGIKEIKINNPNIFFTSTGEIIDEDEETVWTEFMSKWDKSYKLYSSYSIDGGNMVQIMLNAVSDEEHLLIDEFISNLDKYNIPNKMDYDSDETGISLYNFWISKKYFELPK